MYNLHLFGRLCDASKEIKFMNGLAFNSGEFSDRTHSQYSELCMKWNLYQLLSSTAVDRTIYYWPD